MGIPRTWKSVFAFGAILAAWLGLRVDPEGRPGLFMLAGVFAALFALLRWIERRA
jgi:hypothetical protein